MYDADLFGFGDAPAPAPPAPAPFPQPIQAVAAPAPAPFPAPFPMAAAAPPAHDNGIETVSEDSSEDNFEANPAQGEDESLNDDFGTEDPFRQADNAYGGNAPIISGLDDHVKNDSNQFGFQHQKQHNSISSNLSFDRDGIMGGAPIPAASPFSHEANTAPQVGNDIGPAPSLDEVNELKSKAKEAEDTARDAGDTLRQLNARADQLRTVADKAEADARQKESQAAEPPKKKGFMGGGGGGKKKKSMVRFDVSVCVILTHSFCFCHF